MNRLGVTIEEAAAIAPRLSSENHGMTLLMSHLISAETPDNARNHDQMLGFREIRRLFRGIPASLANSSGIFLGRRRLCDLVRPGVALFGLNPTPGKHNPMRRVVELKARIAIVRRIEIGADRRLQRDLDGAAAFAHRDHRRRLRRRIFPRRRAATTTSPAAMSSSAAPNARSSDASRWT